MRCILLFVLLILISGCATATTKVINHIPVPDVLGSQQAEINVCRKYISFADAVTTIISIDREPVLSSTAGKCFSARLSPGGHTLTVMTKGIVGSKWGEFKFILEEGEIKYFDTKLDRIEQISQDDFREFDKNYTVVTVQ